MHTYFWLDLHRQILLGWEREKYDVEVEAIFHAAVEGKVFHPVPVHRVQDEYCLTLERSIRTVFGTQVIDGGHTRAVGHYLAQRPLLCELLPDEPVFFDRTTFCSIPEIALVSAPPDHAVPWASNPPFGVHTQYSRR